MSKHLLPSIPAVPLPAMNEITERISIVTVDGDAAFERIDLPDCKTLFVDIEPIENGEFEWNVRFMLREEDPSGRIDRSPIIESWYDDKERTLHPYRYSDEALGTEVNLRWMDDGHEQGSLRWAPLISRAAIEFDRGLACEGYLQAAAEKWPVLSNVKI